MKILTWDIAKNEGANEALDELFAFVKRRIAETKEVNEVMEELERIKKQYE